MYMVLSICCSNLFEATVSMEEVSCLEKKQTAPIQCSLLAENLHLAAKGPGRAPFKSSRFHFPYTPLELTINSAGTRCRSQTSHLFISCCEVDLWLFYIFQSHLCS